VTEGEREREAGEAGGHGWRGGSRGRVGAQEKTFCVGGHLPLMGPFLSYN